MNLTTEQVAAVRAGEPVNVDVPEAGKRVWLVREELFDRIRALMSPPIATGDLVDQTMVEFDAGDESLASYETYRNG